jgi:hypothetical protein
MAIVPIGQPGAGLTIRTESVRLIAHAALSKGNVVTVDLTSFNGDVFNKTAAIAGAAAKAPANSLEAGIQVVALDNVADGAEGMFAVKGVVDVIAGSAVTVGQGVQGATDLKVDAVGATGKVCGFALTTGALDGLMTVYWDGLNGFGADHA